MNTWEHAWFALLLILGIGLLLGKIAERMRIPDVTLFLLFGILLGPFGLHLFMEPVQSQVNQFVLTLGAAFILFDGGRAVQLAVLKQVWLSITLLATVGVLVTTLVVGTVAHALLQVSWPVSFLLASVIASTDPATLIPVFKRFPILPRLQQTVESESAFNDATASVLVMALLASVEVAGKAITVWQPLREFLHSASLGLAIGGVIGVLALWLVSEEGWGIFHEYGSLAMFAALLGAYAGAMALHASGLMATFTAGIVTGNGASFRWKLSAHTEANIHHFGNALTFLLRILIFVLLGTQVDFSVVHQYWREGLLVVATLMFIARPLSVLVSVLPDRWARWSWRELVMMFWVRETGVIPAALVGIIVSRNIASAHMIASITFLAIMVTIFVQASTTPMVAQKLNLRLGSVDEDL